MKNQSKVILISLIGLIISSILYLFVVRPALDRAADLNKAAVIKKTDLKQLEEQITIYKNSQRDLSLAAGKEVISQSLLPRENLQVAIQEIESAATKIGISESMIIQDNINPSTSKTISIKPIISGKNSIEEIPYNIRVTSDYVQLIDLLSYLEHLPHFTEISGIDLQSSQGTTSTQGAFTHSGQMISSIDAVFFIQKK